LHAGHAGLARPNPSSQFQFPQDQMRRAAWIFTFHIQDQLLYILSQNPALVAILARPRLQRIKAAVAVLVKPLLQRLVRDPA